MTGFRYLNNRRAAIESNRVEAVADMLADSLSIKAISEKLGVSTRTIDKDLATIRKGLGAQAR